MKKLKTIDKSILVGIILTVAFLMLWLITLPKINENFGFSPKLNESESNQKYNEDVNNFNAALLLGNSSYCDLIYNKTLKKECHKVVPDNVVIMEIEELYGASSDDSENFNNAIINNDKTYCNNIMDKTLKEECLNINTENPDDSAIIIEKTNEQPPEYNTEDAENFNRAILNNDKTYCNNIQDEKLKEECISLQV